MISKAKVAVDWISTTLITVLIFISLAYLNHLLQYFEPIFFGSYLIMLFVVTAIFMSSYKDKRTGFSIISGLIIGLILFFGLL